MALLQGTLGEGGVSMQRTHYDCRVLPRAETQGCKPYSGYKPVEYEKGRLTTHYPDITTGTGRMVERHLLETGQETKTNETTTW